MTAKLGVATQGVDGRAKPIDRPRITVHYAQSIDGRIATRTGESQWLGGPDSLKFAHKLRSMHDVVMVGIGTVQADDPRLTVRLVDGASPIRLVLDSSLRIPTGCNLLTDRSAETIIATTEEASKSAIRAVVKAGGEPIVLPSDPSGRVDIMAVGKLLHERGFASVLVEGGRGVITSMLRLGLVDRLTICIAPKIVGKGVDAVGDLGVDYLNQALTFSRVTWSSLGDDIIVDGEVDYP